MQQIVTLPESPKQKQNDEHLSVRHLLPRTKISHAILHDNMSQDRLLQTKKQLLDRRSNHHRLLMDRTKKNFVLTQVRKRGKWKREDDVRINCLNLPTIHTTQLVTTRPLSMKILYSSPSYDVTNEDDQIYVPLRDVMGIPREKTEIISHRSKIAVTRLPSVIHVDKTVLDRYNRYRGAKFLQPEVADKDQRFLKCERLLSNLRVRTPTKSLPELSQAQSPTDVGAFKTKLPPPGFLYESPSKHNTLPVQITGSSPYMRRCMSRRNITNA